MTEQSTDPAREAAVALAGRALQLAMANRWSDAGRLVQRLNDEHPGQGIVLALMAWTDTLLDHATGGKQLPPKMFAAMPAGMINTESGQMHDSGAPAVPARIQWAVDLMMARASLDEERFYKVIDTVPEDPAVAGSYAAAVLETVSQTINGLPRGYLLMGRG